MLLTLDLVDACVNSLDAEISSRGVEVSGDVLVNVVEFVWSVPDSLQVVNGFLQFSILPYDSEFGSLKLGQLSLKLQDGQLVVDDKGHEADDLRWGLHLLELRLGERELLVQEALVALGHQLGIVQVVATLAVPLLLLVLNDVRHLAVEVGLHGHALRTELLGLRLEVLQIGNICLDKSFVLLLQHLLHKAVVEWSCQLADELLSRLDGTDLVIYLVDKIIDDLLDALELLNLAPRLLEAVLEKALKFATKVAFLVLKNVDVTVSTLEPLLRLVDLEVAFFDLLVGLAEELVSILELRLDVLLALELGIQSQVLAVYKQNLLLVCIDFVLQSSNELLILSLIGVQHVLQLQNGSVLLHSNVLLAIKVLLGFLLVLLDQLLVLLLMDLLSLRILFLVLLIDFLERLGVFFDELLNFLAEFILFALQFFAHCSQVLDMAILHLNNLFFLLLCFLLIVFIHGSDLLLVLLISYSELALIFAQNISQFLIQVTDFLVVSLLLRFDLSI